MGSCWKREDISLKESAARSLEGGGEEDWDVTFSKLDSEDNPLKIPEKEEEDDVEKEKESRRSSSAWWNALFLSTSTIEIFFSCSISGKLDLGMLFGCLV